MRTTLTLDPDVAQKVKSRMASEHASLKQVVNEALRRGLSAEPRKSSQAFHVVPHSFGVRPGIDIHKLNQVADDLESDLFVGDSNRAKRHR